MSAPANVIALPIKPRLLVVDDEEMVLRILYETLVREGYEVVTAPDALRALEILRQQPFALILSDNQMPQVSGLEFFAQARQLQPQATRILITAVVSLDTVITAINKGEIYRFIAKPWIREELLVAIKNGVHRHELICQNAALQSSTLTLNETLTKLNAALEKQIGRETEQNQQLVRANQALEQNLRRSVELCMRTMQTFYPSLGAQARRVNELCGSMADSLRLADEQRQILEVSSLLHDIGLVGVPRDLIKVWQRNPEKLRDAERVLIEQHPVLSQDLVGFIHPLSAAGTIIRAHHERFDGTGYPDRLAGENIPWLARLLAVALHYAEAASTNEDRAEQSLHQGSGSAFDPEAVRAFLRSRPAASMSRRERQVLLAELLPGMVLAKGIYTANGLLLIPEGQTLNTLFIDKLQNHNRVNPLKQTLLVYC